MNAPAVPAFGGESHLVLCTQKAEAGESPSLRQPGLHTASQASQSYIMRHCLKTIKQKREILHTELNLSGCTVGSLG